jgi:hypothetical protein
VFPSQHCVTQLQRLNWNAAHGVNMRDTASRVCALCVASCFQPSKILASKRLILLYSVKVVRLFTIVQIGVQNCSFQNTVWSGPHCSRAFYRGGGSGHVCKDSRSNRFACSIFRPGAKRQCFIPISHQGRKFALFVGRTFSPAARLSASCCL